MRQSAPELRKALTRLSTSWVGLLGALGVLFAMTSPAAAATVKVTNTGDRGPGSLHEALDRAKHSAGRDTIKITTTGSISTGYFPTLRVNSDVRIVGPGRNKLKVHGDGGDHPVFAVAPGASARVSGMTISEGNDAFVVRGGELRLSRVTVRSNGLGYAAGGFFSGELAFAVFNVGGKVRVSRSTFEHNFSGDLVNDDGGVAKVTRSTLTSYVENRRDGTLTVSRSTVTGRRPNWTCSSRDCGVISNFGKAGVVGSTLASKGLGMNNGRNAVMAVVRSTVSGDRRLGDPRSEIRNWGHGRLSVKDTIVRSSGESTCSGVIRSRGHNVADDESCNLTGPGDQPSTKPRLRRLDDYGGRTKTFALRPTSPAVDAGVAHGATTDQRGLPRIVDYPGVPKAPASDNSDIGSFELQAP